MLVVDYGNLPYSKLQGSRMDTTKIAGYIVVFVILVSIVELLLAIFGIAY